ncbi:MAG: helicase-exonuclease AddAB subunit AddB [Roseburia sp.]|nr:helicase-exonuclease AddAB subunit AddB [Roseburia sp.]
MSLQFIFGNSGSGKSRYLYQQILEEAKKHPDKNYLILVPEQFTMSTQRELVQLQEAHAIMNVDVLSFARLAYRVFDELGKQNLMVLEETGKNLVLRKVAEEKREDLRVLGSNINKMGYIGEVKSFISELSQYNITPDVLQEFLSYKDMSETLRMKLQDVLSLYKGFRSFLEGKFITSEEVLSLLCEVAEESDIIRDSVIVFDEFTGFTPIQNNLVAKLLTIAEKLIVSVTMDSREDFYHCRGEHELFAMSKKTVKALLSMAGELHVQVEEPVVLEKGWRYEYAKELHFMEQNLFRPWNRKWQEETDKIRMSLHKNPKEELLYVANEIAALVLKEGYRYKDIAVVTGDVNLYANYVPEAFEPYAIPFFIDQTKNIMYHPLIEFVRAALEIIEANFSYESMFRFLRCGLCGCTEEQIDLLENYVLAKGIRGYKKWTTTWTFVREDGTDELIELNQIRAQVVDWLTPLYRVFSEGDTQVKTVTTALYELLTALEVERQMKEKEDAYTEAGDFAKAKEYGQIYRILIDLLDKVVALLGEEVIAVSEYADILDAGFDAAKVAVIPPGNDKVTIGDIERTRLQHVKVLFFVGVNDGVVPKSENKGGIISQFEREMLSASKIELAPGARERVFIQRFYLYLNMTKPSNRLYITLSKVNAEGKALRPSYLTGTIQKLFPKLEMTEVSEERNSEKILTPESGVEFFLQGLQKKTEPEFWKALSNWYLKDEHFREQVQTLLNAAYDSYTEEPISHAVTKALYGTTLENSVTRLERFASCAFAHYLQYGLGLKERELLQFANVDMGNIYHEVLEHFAKQVEASEYSWFDMPQEVADAFVEKALEETIAGYKGAAAFEDSKNRYLLSRMKHTLYCTVWALIHQVKKGHFIPSEFEVSFSGYSDFDAIRFNLSEEEKMNLRGRIDRVDTFEDNDKVYVRIIDYKSGNTSFSLLNLYHGLQLQLVVYMNAAMELVGKKHPGKQVEPAGIFYYHVKHPMVDGTGNESDEEIRAVVLEQLKLNGLVNDNPEVYREMDTELSGTSTVIPVGLKADGSLKAASKVASAEDFSVISEFVNKKITDAGKRIFAGDVAMKPYQLDKQSGCDYCPYHAVCGFDSRLPGHRYRKLDAFADSEEIMEKMRKTEAQDGNELDT